ncbi:DUF1616 domain-containing protein [Methanospirillum lacunae]|uniref:DUF1616 domain-containing protein n=1 Tax=Methanospirillum lacunae TaxID=668570 RepID=A0A2V2N3J1_9EURY|nr:DUF1616 domain-containing protein [Methanospirillum lacunae]PWR74712.1 hypothetical protein DK846_00220 [Methanospirillum lacunae]
MNNKGMFRTDSLLRIPELILLSGLILCVFGLLGILIPYLGPATSIAGIVCGFWLSGYAVMTILFPFKASGERIVTIIGSLLCSITFLTVGALVCEFIGNRAFSYLSDPGVTPFFTSIILLYTTIFVLIALIVVYTRSDRITISDFISEAGSELHKYVPIVAAGLLTILLFLGVALWILSAAQPAETTELWLLNMNHTAADYPTSVHAGEGLTSIIGIHNQEKNTRFFLVTKIQNDTISSRPVILDKGEMTEFPVIINNLTGSQGDKVKITYNLFTEDGLNTTPFRSVSESIRIL